MSASLFDRQSATVFDRHSQRHLARQKRIALENREDSDRSQNA
jgi:hypothetical protein